MEALILAAGKGSRLGKLTKETPKSLLKLDSGKTILETSISCMYNLGVKKFIVICGFQAHLIEEECLKIMKIHDLCIQCIYNPFWDSCNVLGSTFFGLPHLKDNFLFLHADTLFREEILKDILNSSYSNVLSINKKKVGDEEMKIWTENGKLYRISKDGDNTTAFGEFTGLAKFNYQSIALFNRKIREISKSEGHLNYYMEEVLQRDLEENSELNLKFEFFEGLKSIEVDFEEDYSIAKNNF
tara:strand:+ start:132 stop:857 length:726 start_codon:yes stop_codon:yes gene_type:complete